MDDLDHPHKLMILKDIIGIISFSIVTIISAIPPSQAEKPYKIDSILHRVLHPNSTAPSH
jgi:hypothetical protein